MRLLLALKAPLAIAAALDGYWFLRGALDRLAALHVWAPLADKALLDKRADKALVELLVDAVR